MEVRVRKNLEMSVLLIVVKKLLDLLLYCFKLRRDYEKCMHVLLVDNYLAATIRIVRELRGLCGKVRGPGDLQVLNDIGLKVECELSPTSAAAGTYEKAIVLRNLGDKFVEELDKLLKLCIEIDCHTPSRAPSQISIQDIEPRCRKIECLWDDLIKIYLDKACPLGFVERRVKRKVVDIRIAEAVPRDPSCGIK